MAFRSVSRATGFGDKQVVGRGQKQARVKRDTPVVATNFATRTDDNSRRKVQRVLADSSGRQYAPQADLWRVGSRGCLLWYRGHLSGLRLDDDAEPDVEDALPLFVAAAAGGRRAVRAIPK